MGKRNIIMASCVFGLVLITIAFQNCGKDTAQQSIANPQNNSQSVQANNFSTAPASLVFKKLGVAGDNDIWRVVALETAKGNAVIYVLDSKKTLFVSLDGGTTFHMPSGITSPVTDIIADSYDKTLYALNASGVYKSPGATFVPVVTVANTWDSISPGAAAGILYAMDSSGDFYSSTNGQAFALVNNQLMQGGYEVTSPGDGNIYYAGPGSIGASSDGGKTFTVGASLSATLERYSVNGSGIYIGTNGAGLAVDESGGITMYTTSDGLASNVVLDALGYGNKLFVGTSLGLSVSTDFYWSKFKTISPTQGLPVAVVHNLSPGIGTSVYVGTDKGLYLGQ